MQRNYVIQNNKRELEEKFQDEKKRRVSINLAERHFKILENAEGKNRSESLRNILDSLPEDWSVATND